MKQKILEAIKTRGCANRKDLIKRCEVKYFDEFNQCLIELIEENKIEKYTNTNICYKIT